MCLLCSVAFDFAGIAQLQHSCASGLQFVAVCCVDLKCLIIFVFLYFFVEAGDE